jgi:hypothetical protein
MDAPGSNTGAARPRILSTAVLAVTLAGSAAALVAWSKGPTRILPQPSIRIVAVRPLRTHDPALRNLITHTFSVRVAIHGWILLPYQPGAAARDNRARAGHWRLYLDGRSLGDNYGTSRLAYTPYLHAGEHWLAAELSNADSSSLDPAIWSEPVLLHVPRILRCWQTGWQGTPETGTPQFTCNRST